MTTTTTSRRDGVNSGAAIKVACRCATTANITLSGYQTIDGILPTSADSEVQRRVLVKNQTTTTENGIYIMDTGAWSRALDFDTNRDVATGTLIGVNFGTTLARSVWRLTTTGTITFGTSAITFEAAPAVLGSALSSVDSILSLKALSGMADGQVIKVTSYYASSTPDGGGGDFEYDASSSATDNGGTIIAPDAGGVGRWRRVYSGAVNILWFGAKGDDSTDDAAAIQAAHDASRSVFYPQPTSKYRCNSSISIRQDTTIEGANKQNTIIKFYGAKGFYASTSTNGVYDIRISGLYLQGDDSVGLTRHGIHIEGIASNAGRVALRDLVVSDFGGDGIRIERPIVSVMENVQSSSNGQYGFYIGGDGTSFSAKACYASSNGSDGWYVYRNIVYSTLTSCASDSNTGCGYNFDGTTTFPAQDITLVSCGAESNGSDYFKFVATTGLTMSACFVYPGAVATGGHFIHLDGVRHAALVGIRMAQTPAAAKYALNLSAGSQSPSNVRGLGCSFASINNNNDAYDDAGEAPEAFIAMAGSFQNSWVDFGGSEAPAAYYKDPDGTVHLRGTVKSGTIGAVVFTLPSGYRPTASRNYGTVSNGAFGYCSIDSSGNIVAAVGNNTYFSFDGIYFRAAA